MASRRTKSIGTKVTPEEYERIHALAGDQPISEWVRAALLNAADASPLDSVVLAELLVPAITLSPSATTPVPPVLIQFGWAQTLPLALAVAVLPVLGAALTIARRPDAAAELRAAETP